MKKLIKIIFCFLLLFCTGIYTAVYILSSSVEKSYKINFGSELNIDSFVPVTAVYNGVKNLQTEEDYSVGDSFKVDLKIFGVIPFSTVDVEVVDEMSVAVLGNPFGMKIYTDGVLVIESTDIVSENGTVNPALDAGIKTGDYIKSVNGQKITCNEELSQIVTESQGKTLEFEVVRNQKTFNCNIKPVLDTETGIYRIGIWVRDSSAGIGTLTFYSPSANVICGLGHGICDSDTETLLNIDNGELVGANIVSVEKGSAGNPGALKGKFTYDTIADISLNCDMGVYGFMKRKISVSNLTEIALKQDVKNGAAQILCTVDGETPKLYSCEIEKLNSYGSKTQNLSVKVTDKELIEITGGIVQGMSGSPILQNGKLVGALTHVLVNDSLTGYGIYAENMLDTAQNVVNEQLKSAS